MTTLLINVCEKLNVDADHIMDALNRRPGPEVLTGMEEKIWMLEKERDGLQARVNWTEGELSVAR